MQTVALYWWHEIGPFVPCAHGPLILRADEGQQRKQNCPDNDANHAVLPLKHRGRVLGSRSAAVVPKSKSIVRER